MSDALKANYVNPSVDPFIVAYVEDGNVLVTTPTVPNLKFAFFSDEELKAGNIGWNGPYYNSNELHSMNNVLRNRKNTLVYSSASPYQSNFFKLT